MGRSKGKSVLYISHKVLFRWEECFINWSTVLYETSKLIVMHGTLAITIMLMLKVLTFLCQDCKQCDTAGCLFIHFILFDDNLVNINIKHRIKKRYWYSWLTFVLYSDKLGFTLLLHLNHRSEVSCKNLKSTECHAMQIKVVHCFWQWISQWSR